MINIIKKKNSKELENNNRTFNFISFFINYAIYIVLLLLFLTIIIIDPSFLSLTNFGFILSQSAPRIIIALAVGTLLITGGADLSAGRMVGLSAILCGSLLQSPNYALRIFPGMPVLPLIIPLLISMVVCALFSCSLGLLVAKLKVEPFIVSLGLSMVVYGIQSVYFDYLNHSSPIGGLDPRYSNFAQGGIQLGGLRIPYIVLYAIIVTVGIWFMWHKTSLGKSMYAIGGNIEAAVVSGVRVTVVLMILYAIAGSLYGFGGFLEGARTGSVTNSLGSGYELDAIAACVVGGVSLRGGIGSISGVITGVLIFQVINYGLVFISINPYIQFIIKGAIIILAVSIDTQKYIQKK